MAASELGKYWPRTLLELSLGMEILLTVFSMGPEEIGCQEFHVEPSLGILFHMDLPHFLNRSG